MEQNNYICNDNKKLHIKTEIRSCINRNKLHLTIKGRLRNGFIRVLKEITFTHEITAYFISLRF